MMHYITLYYLLQHGAIVDTANTMRHTKLWENMALSTKLKYTMCCIRRQPATATVDLHRKFCKVWHIVFEICEQTEKDIQRHTDRLITTLHTRPGGEVMKCRHMQVTQASSDRGPTAEFVPDRWASQLMVLSVLLTLTC